MRTIDSIDANITRQTIKGPKPSHSSWKSRGHFCVGVLAGLVLVFAAAMKWESPIDTVPIAGLIATGQGAKVPIVLVEVVLGLWLISGAFARMSRYAAIGCFSLFLCVAAYEALAGAESCGCFGNVRVHPAYSAGLDAVAVIAFAYSRPMGRHGVQWSRPVLLRLLLIIAAMAGGAAGLVAHRQAGTVEEGDNITPGQLVVLEPDTWIGKRLPILRFIDRQEELATGRWTIILFHHDCPACRAEIPGILKPLTVNGGDSNGISSVALIEVPPYGDLSELIPRPYLHLVRRLNSNHEWFVHTPSVVTIDDGIVLAAQ